MNSIRLKTLNELLQHSFYISSYQRGYRWTAQEVKDLLNDINEFAPREINETEEKTWYCLQPIVVKNKSENEYEVIDGQQRLTTAYLVLHYLNQDFVEKKRDKLFMIDYQTRQDSKNFLQNPEKQNDSCIDFFYMHEAYTTIEKWFEEKEEDPSFDKNEYRSKLKFHTKVIWYETIEDNPITVFTRLNIGKISLTNAELIKALFLNSSNFRSSNADRMRLRQIEIANVKELYDKSSALRKSEFISYIDEIIKRHYKNQNLFDLDYENKNTKSILLLYNILTMLQNKHDSSCFPFDDFKLNKWNIEHIASRKDSSSIPIANRKEWLLDVQCYIDKEQEESQELINQLEEMSANDTFAKEDEFTALFDKVTGHFNKHMKESEDIDGISNLTLLDEKTNKGYKNAVFPLKRKCIIELDKTGGFVPICTKNVFLKYFSDYPPKISFWTQDDREKYEEDLVRVLTNYLEVNK